MVLSFSFRPLNRQGCGRERPPHAEDCCFCLEAAHLSISTCITWFNEMYVLCIIISDAVIFPRGSSGTSICGCTETKLKQAHGPSHSAHEATRVCVNISMLLCCSHGSPSWKDNIQLQRAVDRTWASFASLHGFCDVGVLIETRVRAKTIAD